MIDDPAEALELMLALEAELPFQATVSKHLVRMYKWENMPTPRSARVEVVNISYLGDRGGIICRVDD